MNKPNIVTTPSRNRMVLIPFEEYERLIEAAEDAADARAADEIKRRLATGEEELILAEIVDRMIGKREGTIETFKKLAAVLRVDIDDIAKLCATTAPSGRRSISYSRRGTNGVA